MTTETKGTAETAIDADKLFTEPERELIIKMSGWEEYQDQQLRQLYGDPRVDETATAEPDANADIYDIDDAVEADDALLNFLNGDGDDPLRDEDKDKDHADEEPTTEVLLKEFLGPRYDFLATMEARKKFVGQLGREVQGSLLFKKDVSFEAMYLKLLYYYGHITRDTLDAVSISLKSRAGTGSGSNYGSDADKKRMLNEYLLSLPFGIVRKTNTISHVRQSLDDSLFGLLEAKKKILQHLVLSAHGSGQSEGVLLVGPPGTGKTALASAVASALGLPFAKISFAGLADIITLKGSNSGWSSSQVSFLVKELCRVQCSNPVMLLDEVDKSAGYGGSAGAVVNVLAELLDPRQNNSFRDLFLEFPVDFSRVQFILTANEIGDIPSYIIDRCSVIEVEAYTLDERATIIQRYIPRQIVSDYCFNFSIEITPSASKEFARSHESLREARRAVMSHVSAMLENHEPGHVPKLVIKKYDASLVPPPASGGRSSSSKAKKIAGFASARGDDNPQGGGSQGPCQGM